MREIFFRGKTERFGNWIEGSLIIGKDLESDKLVYLIAPLSAYYTGIEKVIPETVGQFTGLTANGTKIFEGDICRFREWSKGDMCWIGKVHYEHQQFVISGNPNKECESEFLLAMSRFISENIEVIGNIHDNKLEDFENGC